MNIRRIRHNPAAAVLFAMLVFVMAAAAFSIGRCYAFKCALVDLGAFQQAMDTLLARGVPLNTISPPYVEQYWFGYHFTPVMYLLAPLYALFPSFHTLQILQALLVASAAWPIYLTCRRFMLTEKLSAVLAVVFLLNPYVFSGALWDIHEVAIAVPIMAWCLWSLAAARFRTLLLLCMLLLTVKEHFGLSVFGFGLLWGLVYRQWWRASIVMILGLTGFILIVNWAMPAFSPTGELLITGSTVFADERYGWINKVWNGEMLLLPQLQKMSVDWASYVSLLFVPLLFLPLMSMLWLLPAGADLAVNALASGSILRTIQGYHNMTVAVVLVVATARTIAAASNPLRIKSEWVVVASVVCFIVTLWLQMLLWQAKDFRFSHTAKDAQAISDIREKLKAYPAAALHGNIGIWFLHDTTPYLFPDAREKMDAWVLWINYPADWQRASEGPVSYTPEPVQVKGMRLALEREDYGVTYWNAPWMVMEKGKTDIVPQARQQAMHIVEQMEAAIKAKELSSK